jgi:hypothetical protein
MVEEPFIEHCPAMCSGHRSERRIVAEWGDAVFGPKGIDEFVNPAFEVVEVQGVGRDGLGDQGRGSG